MKYRQKRRGVKFAKPFLVGRERNSLFHTSSAKKLNAADPPIITVSGKAFFDVGHSLKDQSKNREKASSWLRCMGNSSGDETNSSIIRVYNKAGNVIETHERNGDFKDW